MGHGNNQLNMSHAFAAHLLLGNFHTTTVAHDAFVTDAFVLSAVALVIFYRAEYAFTEETVALGFVSAVVDGLGFQHFTAGLFKNLLGRSQSYRDF